MGPGIHNLVAKNEARVLIYPAHYVKEYQATVIVTTEEVINKDPEMVRNCLKARAKGVKFIRENPERTIAIWAEELEAPVEAVRLAYKDLKIEYYEIGAPKEANMKGRFKR